MGLLAIWLNLAVTASDPSANPSLSIAWYHRCPLIWSCVLLNFGSRAIWNTIRLQSWGIVGVTTPRFWAGVSWMGRETLLHLIMYRKYVRKWWLFKRNRIICLEFSCKWQILYGYNNRFFQANFKKISNFPAKQFAWKIEIFRKFAWKNRKCFFF